MMPASKFASRRLYPSTSHRDDEFGLGGGGGSGSSIENRVPLSSRLNALKIFLDLAGSSASNSSRRGSVRIDCAVGGEHKALLECSADEINLPVSVTEARRIRSNDQWFALPAHILDQLCATLGDTAIPLWLSFPAPSGFLPALPWERMLRTTLTSPSILRLSYQAIQPITPGATRDIVLCVSFARAKETATAQPPAQILESFFTNFPANIAAYSTFHLFTDAALMPAATDLRNRTQGKYKIRLYDPGNAARYAIPEQDSDPDSVSDPVDNPWLIWMRESLGAHSVDVVHFITHGYLGRQDGFLALSESPLENNDEEIARFVGSRQISAFLDQVGAWSVAFSSPPGNYSILGTRMLQDQIARSRPGPVLLHDMAADPDRSGLAEAYQFAYAIEEAFPPMSTAVNLSCHPEWAMPWTEGDTSSRALLDELTLSGRMSEILEGPSNTPSWLASGQRALETSLAQLLAGSPGDPERVLKSGAADALRFTADLLQKHAVRLTSGLK
jgi:hypothetical protein